MEKSIEEMVNAHKTTIKKNLAEEFKKATVFPDIRLDQHLLEAFGQQSLKILTRHYEKIKKDLNLPIDVWLKSLGVIWGNLTPIPGAAGLGAFVIGVIIDIIFAEHKRKSTADNFGKVFECVFAQEKASKVRDIMEEYVKRHQMHIRNLAVLKEELTRLEKDLSFNLTQLKNSMREGHMNSKALKIWINGACFHIQMRIHLARLGDGDSSVPARAIIAIYKNDWEMLINEYKMFKRKSVKYTIESNLTYKLRILEYIYKVYDDESQQTFQTSDSLELKLDFDPVEMYVDQLIASSQIEDVRQHFRELQEHLEELINQRDAFDLN